MKLIFQLFVLLLTIAFFENAFAVKALPQKGFVLKYNTVAQLPVPDNSFQSAEFSVRWVKFLGGGNWGEDHLALKLNFTNGRNILQLEAEAEAIRNPHYPLADDTTPQNHEVRCLAAGGTFELSVTVPAGTFPACKYDFGKMWDEDYFRGNVWVTITADFSGVIKSEANHFALNDSLNFTELELYEVSHE